MLILSNDVYYNLKSTLIHPFHPFEYKNWHHNCERKNGNLTTIDDNDAIACA